LSSQGRLVPFLWGGGGKFWVKPTLCSQPYAESHPSWLEEFRMPADLIERNEEDRYTVHAEGAFAGIPDNGGRE